MAIFTKYKEFESLNDYLNTLIKEEVEVNFYAKSERVKAFKIQKNIVYKPVDYTIDHHLLGLKSALGSSEQEKISQVETVYYLEGLSGYSKGDKGEFTISDFNDRYEEDKKYSSLLKDEKYKVYKPKGNVVRAIEVKHNIRYTDASGNKSKRKVGDFLVIYGPAVINISKRDKFLRTYSKCDANGKFLDDKLNNLINTVSKKR